mgnify:FL=1
MQKVGINELYEMIVEELDLYEKTDQDVIDRTKKKALKKIKNLVIKSTFQHMKSQINLSPKEKAKLANDIIN